MRPKDRALPSPATVSPADFPIGSPQSRAAARHLLARRHYERIAAAEGTPEWQGTLRLAALVAGSASGIDLRGLAVNMIEQGITSVAALTKLASEARAEAGNRPRSP